MQLKRIPTNIYNTTTIKSCSLGTIHPRDGAERSGAKAVNIYFHILNEEPLHLRIGGLRENGGVGPNRCFDGAVPISTIPRSDRAPRSPDTFGSLWVTSSH